MQGVSVVLFLGILARWSCGAVFLNHRPFPTYSLENMPNTQFSCREKILGGYYADPDTECQMFHVCVKVAGIGVQDFRFLCPNGTAFDQDHQICADWEDVDCDATTLYYSSDNFDLYRVGSGFESKAHKYGEDEEPFALQRAETGDARINREPQVKVINQQKENVRNVQPRRNFNSNNNNNNNNQEKDIFKGSSSSNFFNNRNNGKETEDDYDDNVNFNQNRDFEQRRKIVRKQQKRPVAQQQSTAPPQSTANDQQTRRPQRPTGFVNNFAGSYNPTTPRSSTIADQHPSTSAPINSFRIRGQRQRVTNNNNNNYASPSSPNSPTPSYTISTPAPFRQSPITTNKQTNNGQYYSSTSSTENYPQPRPSSVSYNTNYDVQKVTKQQTENYPSNNPQYTKPTTPFANTGFDKKPTSPKKFETYKPTTFSPNAKPFSFQQNAGLPTTLAPRTQQAYTQIAQQTNTFNTQKTQNPTTYNTQTNQQSFSTFAQQQYHSTTQKPTTFTQYTPTVPKISPTTPVSSSRSSRFDETQYDDGSYDSKYEYNSGGDDEFLKAAHSQNIASSRNELARAQKSSTTTTTLKPYEVYTTKPTENYPKSFPTRNTQRPVTATNNNKAQAPPAQPSGKKVKDVSYDYAYYDSLGPEPDYQIDTEIKKATN